MIEVSPQFLLPGLDKYSSDHLDSNRDYSIEKWIYVTHLLSWSP